MNNKKTIGIVAGIVGAAVVAGVIVLLILSPWQSKEENGDNSQSNTAQSNATQSDAAYNTKGKCKFYECLNKVTSESTEEEVEAIIGFAPKVEKDETRKTETYTWSFDDDHTIQMSTGTSYKGEKYTVSIKIKDYNNDDIAQKGVTFDKVKELKSKINKDDGVSYDMFKEYMGGVDGVLMEVGSTKKYEWRSADADGYMTGTFNSDNRCTFMSGIAY